jgi:hypothetical protein
MIRCLCSLRHLIARARTLPRLLMEAWRFLRLCLRPSPALAVENLFPRLQLALYQERHRLRSMRTGHGPREQGGRAFSGIIPSFLMVSCLHDRFDHWLDGLADARYDGVVGYRGFSRTTSYQNEKSRWRKTSFPG